MGKTALITDAGHFLGPPGTRALREAGWQVFAVDADAADPAKRPALEEKLAGAHILDTEDPEEAVAEVIAQAGSLDLLVNNDSFPALRGAVGEAREEDLAATYEALVFKAFRMTQAAAKPMKEAGKGKILFITSAAPLNGIPNYSIYASARGAANTLALTLSKELARFNIQVNAIAPNFVESPDYFPESLMADPKNAEKILKNIPLGRLGKPEEAASLITYLASPGADFITGQIVPLAGGWATAR